MRSTAAKRGVAEVGGGLPAVGLLASGAVTLLVALPSLFAPPSGLDLLGTVVAAAGAGVLLAGVALTVLAGDTRRMAPTHLPASD